MLGEMGTYGSMADGTSFEALNLRECQRTFFDLFGEAIPSNLWRGMGFAV